MDLVAAKGTETLTLALATNATARVFIQAPSSIGRTQYWLQLKNDSEKTWLEGGLGNAPLEGVDLRVYLPKMVLAEGTTSASTGRLV